MLPIPTLLIEKNQSKEVDVHLGDTFELSCSIKDDEFNSISWFFIPKRVLDSCPRVDEQQTEIQTIYMPIHTLELDNKRYDIYKREWHLEQMDIIEEKLVIKNVSSDNLGVVVCMVGHSYSIRYFTVNLNIKPYSLSTMIHIEHLAVATSMFAFGIIVFTFSMFIVPRRCFRRKKKRSSRVSKDGQSDTAANAAAAILAAMYEAPPPPSSKQIRLQASQKSNKSTGNNTDKKLICMQNNLLFSDSFKVENIVDEGGGVY